MKLLFKQRLFSWFDSYDIFDESGNTVYTVQGRLSWGHKLEIYDAAGKYLGRVRERVFTWLPVFEIYEGEAYRGCIRKKFRLFTPQFDMDFNGWRVDGEFWEWDYTITDSFGVPVARIGKELFHLTDTYVIDTSEENALYALMAVLAIDAEKCSRRQ